MATNEKVGIQLDIRGVDMVTPVDLLSDGRTPWSKNFRLYAQQSDSRQVAVSSRKGPGKYIEPLVETQDASNESAGDGDALIGVTANIAAQKISVTDDGRLNRVDLRLRSTEGAFGPVIISLYSDQDGRPTRILSQSSIGSGDISDTFGWVTARFVNAPLVSDGQSVWIVVETQDDGGGFYEIETVSTGTNAKYSDTSFASLEDVSWGINYRTFLAPDERCKGGFRYNRENGTNITVAVYGDTLYALNPTTNVWSVVKNGLNSSADFYSFDTADGKLFWVNGYDNLMCWDGVTVTTITDPELPVLSMITFHKDRLFGVVANDKNKIVWSEAPGNPEGSPSNQQWYNAWLSTSFTYVPAPKTGSPVTGIVSFQDSLIIFTQNGKYVLSGYDAGSYTLRQSTGFKGALHFRNIAHDENFIYFVSDDGLYSFNGSKDDNISIRRIQPLFAACPDKEGIVPVVWENKVRFYMASQASTVNDICALYNRGLDGEWEIDTDTFVDFAVHFDDADDSGELLEFSSQYAMPFLAEQAYNSLGAPIDFEYRFKYDSMGLPAQKKRLRRYYPILQGVDSTFKINIAMDKDFQDSPRNKDVLLAVNGAKWGSFSWGDGTTWGGDKSFKHHRQSYSGSAYYWQLRVARKGVNNRVAFVGAQYKYRIKRM